MNCIKQIILFILVLKSGITTAQDLQKKMDSLLKKERFYEYWDAKNKDVYAFGWIEQRYGIPVFRHVSLDKTSRVVTIEGITTMTGSAADTAHWGYCPFGILAAQPDSNHHLHNIRKLSTTYCQGNDPAIKDGFFSVKFKILPNDILIIGNPGRAGYGAIVYNISRLLKN